MTLDNINVEVEAADLAFRGAFHPDKDDLPPGEAAGTLVMLGFVGGEQWAGFAVSPEYRDRKPNPLDRWSHRVISTLAQKLGARAYFPFLAPFMPFVKWAQKAEAVTPSEIGMLIHPDYGLWHAWRGALAFEKRFTLPPRDLRPRPCDTCVEKPCLSSCPVEAFSGGGAYNVAACGAHIRKPEGASCMSYGCLARRACPVGKDYRYGAEQAAFHMKSFRGG